VSVSAFQAFKAELSALIEVVSAYPKKTIRDDDLRERFRMLFRTWTFSVRPTIEQFLESKQDFLKLHAEVEWLAKLTYKYKPVTEYCKRLLRAIQLADNLVLFLPPTKREIPSTRLTSTKDLFIPTIPDLPARFVPNSIIGWRSKLETFLNQHPFDKSIFIMIRYRSRNSTLITRIKAVLEKKGFYGILASEHKLTDDLYNPIACLLCCSKGLAIFDKPESSQEFNPNVAYELGMIHLLIRDCLILKHQTLEILHTDIIMKVYQEYNTVKQVEKHINNWLGATD
jgi:hypothetical protein